MIDGVENMGGTASPYRHCRPRALLFRQWLAAEDERGQEAYLTRQTGMRKTCLVCNKPLVTDGSGSAEYYFETADGGAGGFIEDACYLEFLGSAIFQFNRELSNTDPAWEMIRESASKFILSVQTGRLRKRLMSFISQGKATGDADPRDGFLVVHPVDPQARNLS